MFWPSGCDEVSIYGQTYHLKLGLIQVSHPERQIFQSVNLDGSARFEEVSAAWGGAVNTENES